jgi:hypothetical protein
MVCALLNTLHSKDDEEVPQGGASGVEEGRDGQGMGMLGRWSKRPMTRYRYFMIMFVGSFLFFFLPGAFFFLLSIPRADDLCCRLSFPSTLDLFFHMLGGPEQRRRQPAVWRAVWVGNVLPDV